MDNSTTGYAVLTALHQYQLKQSKPNEWRCNSPLRPGSNSHALVITIEPDGEHGAYHDHVSGDSGSLYDLAKLLNIPIAQATPIADTKRSYADIADYAAAHGLTADQLSKAGWRQTIKDDRPALVFKTKSGERFRFLDGNKPAYKSPQGYKRCWYGLNSATIQRVAAGQPLIIANGEISALAGHVYGMASIAVTAGEKEIPTGLLDELTAQISRDVEIIIALDCDETGRNAARLVLAQLVAAGYRARAVDLRLGNGGDLADFCMIHGPDAAATIIRLPDLSSTHVANEKRRRWRIVDLDELSTLPTIKWLLPGELVDRGINIIYGPSGIGKSFYSLDCALRVAETMPVIYVAAEGESGYYKRVGAWKKHHKVTALNIKFCLGAVALMNQEDRAAFIDAIRPYRPRLVVIDTLSRTMLGADENRQSDMALYVDACDEIRRELSCSVAVVHHTGKAGSSERGSSVLRAGVDAMIRLSGDDNVVRIESNKVKDDPNAAPQYRQLLPVILDDGTTSCVLAPTTQIRQTPDDPLTTNQRLILEALTLKTFTDGATLADLVDATDIWRGSLHRTISNLITLGFVDKAKTIYSISPIGREKISNETGNKMTHDSRDSWDSTQKAITQISPSIDSHESHESLPKTDESSHESAAPQRLFGPQMTPRPTEPCPNCHESRWVMNPFGEWRCTTCAQQIEETHDEFRNSSSVDVNEESAYGDA